MRGDRERLEDIAETCRVVREQLSTRREALATDPLVQAAAQRWLEIIGEAASRVSPELRDAYPEVPRTGVIGMGNILAHGNFDIDPDIVGNVIERDIPALERAVARILDDL